jgi:hypothetical protein
MTKMGRFARSWELTEQSATILSENKSLMVFPVLSAIATIVVIASFFVPLFMSGALEHVDRKGSPQAYLMMFAFYFISYFVQIFFNCALMASANMAFCGGKATVSDGLGMAWMRLPQIIFYSAIAATVGMLLRMLEERVGWIGRLIIALMGAAWSIMTYFIAPVIVFEGLGGMSGVERSAQLIKKTWGEGLGKGLTWFAITLVATVAGIAATIGLMTVSATAGILFAVTYFLLLATVISTLDGIFKVALYRYAVWNEVPAGYSPELIQSAFLVKEKKGWFGN